MEKDSKEPRIPRTFPVLWRVYEHKVDGASMLFYSPFFPMEDKMKNDTYVTVAKAAVGDTKPKAQAVMTPAAAAEVAGSEQVNECGTSFTAPVYGCPLALVPDALAKYACSVNITGIEFAVLTAMMSPGVTFAGELAKSTTEMIAKALEHALTPMQVERARRRLLNKDAFKEASEEATEETPEALKKTHKKVSKKVIEPLNRVTTDGNIVADRPNKGHVASYRIATEIWNTVELPGREAYSSQAKNMKRRRGGVLVTGAAKVTRYASGKYTAVPLGLAVEMAARKLGSCATHVLILIMKALDANGRAWIEKVRYGELPIDTRRLRDGLGELLRSSKNFNALVIEETIDGETYYRIAPDIWAMIPRKKSSPKAAPQAEGGNWQNDPIYREHVTTL